jgi:hypothetical protein
MHCEKNLGVNVIKTIVGEKDGRKVWQDLQVLGIQQSSWLRVHLSQSAKVVILEAPWVMPRRE